MALKVCRDCGEEYSDTYKRCPFCEEDWVDERKPTRSRRRRVNIMTPILLMLIVIMAGLLGYLLFGENLMDRFAFMKPTPGPNAPVEEPVQQETPVGPESQLPPEGTSGEGVEQPPEEQIPAETPELDYAAAAALPDGLQLSTTDFTLQQTGAYALLSVSGGSGTYVWLSEDEGIASVDETGKVVGVSGGMTHVVVTDGSRKAICIVRVRGAASTGSSEGGGSHTLNRTDMTLPVGQSFQLKLSGATGQPEWSVADSSVATVSANGTVVAAARGNTTVTASWNGSTYSCIVRVSG